MPPTSPQLPSPTRIAEPVAGLLARLTVGWSPLPFALGTVVTATNGPDDLTDRFLSARIDGGLLEVRFRTGLRESMTALEWDSLVLITEAGVRIESHVGTTSFRSDSGTVMGELVVTSRTWAATPPEPPVLWVGRLSQSTRLDRWMGNLDTQRPYSGGSKTSHGHLTVESPSARLYLLWSEEGSEPEWLVVEPVEAVERRELWRDRMLLRTVLGIPLDISSFTALDGGGEPIGKLVDDGGVSGQATSKLAGSLVPLRPSRDVGNRAWSAPFFRKLAATYRMDGVADPVTTAVFRYGYTLSPMDMDTEFVLVAGATWVLLRALASGGASTLPDASTIMDGLLQARDALERGEGATREALLVLTSFLEGDREREFLLRLDEGEGQVLYDDLLRARAVWERGQIRGEGVEATETTADDAFVRVQRMRRAFGVLLGHAISYGGPVASFAGLLDAEPLGWLPDPPPDADDRAEAEIQFVAATENDVDRLWPDFRVPEVPDSPLTRALVAFADEVRVRTEGAVTARLRPLPERSGEPLRLSFRVRLAEAPSVHVALFAVRLGDDEVTVQGWEGGERVLHSEDEIVAFGNEVMGSEELQYQVRRLLLIGDDLRHGEIAPRT